MADYLIEQYNERVQEVQDREAKALTGALEIYTAATHQIVETAALERVEAGAALAAAMSQRDHEYQNGRPPLPIKDLLPKTEPRSLFISGVITDAYAAKSWTPPENETDPLPDPPGWRQATSEELAAIRNGEVK